MNRTIRTTEDVLTLLDGLFPPAEPFWDRFYADRSADRPFFAPKPDENLVSYLDRGILSPSRALDLGCGPGRNAIHLAAAGFEVDAVDLSSAAVAWAEERAREAGTTANLRFHQGSIFEAELPPTTTTWCTTPAACTTSRRTAGSATSPSSTASSHRTAISP